MKRLFNQFKIFKDISKFLPPKLLPNVYKNIEYEVRKENDVVFYEGDLAQKVYIIIDGEVEIIKMKSADKLNTLKDKEPIENLKEKQCPNLQNNIIYLRKKIEK